MDDKLGLRPRKPPRRNLSISPVRIRIIDLRLGSCRSFTSHNQIPPCFQSISLWGEEQQLGVGDWRLLVNLLQKDKGYSSKHFGVHIVNDMSLFQGHKTVYSSKSGSKSFDELDDLLCEKPRKSNSKRRGRRTQSSVSGADVLKAAERRQAAERRRGGAAPECRHSCDEVTPIILSYLTWIY